VDAALMLLIQHERGIHALSAGADPDPGAGLRGARGA
jgi:hypothetical protein